MVRIALAVFIENKAALTDTDKHVVGFVLILLEDMDVTVEQLKEAREEVKAEMKKRRGGLKSGNWGQRTRGRGGQRKGGRGGRGGRGRRSEDEES